MKQEMITYLSTFEDKLFDICKKLSENCEESYKEHESSKLLIDTLREFNFSVEENYLDISTAFFAKIGSGHPKICFLCDYDSDGSCDILATNLRSTIALGSALTLSKIMDKISGTIVVVGCPGELMGGSKNIMTKQGVFDDMDAVLTVRPHTTTAEGGTSMAVLPIEINYKNKENYSHENGSYSSLDACLYTMQGLNLLIKAYGDSCFINGLNITSPCTPYFSPDIMSITFYVKGSKMSLLETVEGKIKDFVLNTEKLMDIDSEIHFHQLPCYELIPNDTLSRIFAHNLKEAGIIEIEKPRDTHLGMSLGSVSNVVPCLSPYLGITSDKNIEPYSKEFSSLTNSSEALHAMIKGIHALCFTTHDLLTKQDLITEAKKELHSRINK